MAFECRQAWHVTFIEEGRSQAIRKLIFQDSAKIVEIARKGGHPMNLEGRQALEMGIDTGRGGVMLELTPDQFAKLNR
jgi:hypothetical protein